jgi:hypothetical protein
MNKTVFATLAVIAPVWTGFARLAISRYEGWGQWAAAPLLLLPLLYGSLIGLTGLAHLYADWRRREPIGWWLGWSLVAFYPLWLVLLRRL